MIELVRDLRVIIVLAKLENDPRKIMDVGVLTGLVCPAAHPLGRRQYPGALKGCGVKRPPDMWLDISAKLLSSVARAKCSEVPTLVPNSYTL